MSRQSAVPMDLCLACLLKPSYRCEACDKVEVCDAHSNQFTLFQCKDPEAGMMISCSGCRVKVSDSFNGKMHWSQNLKEYMGS